MRGAFYARVSSLIQRDKHTIDSQLSTLPAYLRSLGATSCARYIDDGRSAKTGSGDRRDDFRRLLADMAAGKLDILAVVDLDRITRTEDLEEQGTILGAFQRSGVRLAISSTNEVLDLRTDTGALFALIKTWAGGVENAKRRERTIRGKIEAAQKGKKPAGPTLYGYAYDKETGTWSVNETAAAVVRECFRRVAAGESCYRVCLDLDARGAFRPRGGRWNRGRVWTLVTNRGYTGRLVVDKKRGLSVAIPRLVSDELFDRAQAMLPHNREPLRAPRTRHASLLEGIAVCGECGAKIAITGSEGIRKRAGLRDVRKKRYYVCSSRRVPPGSPRSCAAKMVPVAVADEAAWAKIRERLDRPDLLAGALAAPPEDGGGTDWAAELAGYDRQLEALERREAAILERFRRGQVSDGAMDRELAAAKRQRQLLERNRDLARQELASSRRSRQENAALIASLDGLRARVAAASAAERQEITRLLVPGRDGLVVTLWRDRLTMIGRLAPQAPTISRALVAGSRSERSEDHLFRAVAMLR